MSDKKFYLTTPIYYVNARPHIGHAYTTIVADVLARRHRLLGEDTFFLTGTDEHGQKIERSAAAANIPPQQFADQVSKSFEDLWKRMGITNNAYIRTTDPNHKRGVQKLFSELYERGFIYLASYTGSYCVSDEAFVDAPVGTPCPDCGRTLEEVTEENFFFKLSAFQLPLLDLIESDTIAITPDSRKNEVHQFLTGNVRDLLKTAGGATLSENPDGSGVIFHIPEKLFDQGRLARTKYRFPFIPGALKDLSISRSSFTWGIPVPEPAASAAAQKHVIYVWLDALANYMTAIGYGSDDSAEQQKFNKFWPADLHLVGKEIIRFHCVYWPAFLLALNPAFNASFNAPGPDAVILSEGRSPQSKDPEGANPTTAAETFSTTPAAPPPLTIEQHKAWAAKWLPKAITAHGWLLFEDSKMSKSKGNIVRTETILEGFGEHVYAKQFPDSSKQERDLFASDVLRYFLLREIPFGQDGSFSFDALITRYNADLANGYGNLVSRTLKMIDTNCAAAVPASSPEPLMWAIIENGEGGFQKTTGDLMSTMLENLRAYNKLIEACDFSSALSAPMAAIAATDRHISDHAPWKLAKAEDEASQRKLREILYTAAESIRIVTAILYPILPNATAKVWAQLGLGNIEIAASNGELNNLEWGGLKPGTKLGPLGPIFPRADKGLAQIMTDMETPAPHTSENPRRLVENQISITPSTDPAAPPRTTSIREHGPLPVGGSTAHTTGPDHEPSHADTIPSAPFNTIASKTPITSGPTDASPQISIDDFARIELRVAQIVVAERIPKADKLLRLEVELGPDFPRRQILSGIAEWYTPEDLIGRRIVVITNLAPRKMRGLESHGMLLAASDGDHGKPHLAICGDDIPLGSRLK
jgi:methionyl-tRNA synthetase